MHFISPVLWQFLVKWLTEFALFPPEASAIAPYMDAFYFFLLLISLVGLVLVGLMVGCFSIMFRWRCSWSASCGVRCFTSASTTRRPTR
jgi:cytochrome c oxidase subunit 2